MYLSISITFRIRNPPNTFQHPSSTDLKIISLADSSLGRMACALGHLRLGRTLQVLPFFGQNLKCLFFTIVVVMAWSKFSTDLGLWKEFTEKWQKWLSHFLWLKVRAGVDEICWWLARLPDGLWKALIFLKSHRGGLSDCEVGGCWWNMVMAHLLDGQKN